VLGDEAIDSGLQIDDRDEEPATPSPLGFAKTASTA
jgi:hypothetical protein